MKQSSNNILLPLSVAREIGANTYYTGKPCIRGHFSLRRTSKSSCIECETCEDYMSVKKKYYENNIQQHRNYSKAWLEKNMDKHKASASRWWSNNKKKSLEYVHKRRKYVDENGGNFTSNDIDELILKSQLICMNDLCCEDLSVAGFHIDHILPLSRGGSNNRENLQLLCPRCNMRKGNLMPDEWEEKRKRICK